VNGKLSGISDGSISGLDLSCGLIGPISDRRAADGDAITAIGNIGAIIALSMSGAHRSGRFDCGCKSNCDGVFGQRQDWLGYDWQERFQ
jgi:hypothetical protein